MSVQGLDHTWETCPVFGGCDDCRSAKFQKASPDVKLGPIATYLSNSSKPWTAFWREHPRVPVRRGMQDPSTIKYDVDPRPTPFRDPKGAHNPTPALVAGAKGDIASFDKAVNASLARSNKVSNVRGDEYGDSWALPNIVTTYLDVVLDRLGIPGLSLEAKRLLESASIVDVKESRIKNGAWKLDNSDDGINYRAAFAAWYTEYEGG